MSVTVDQFRAIFPKKPFVVFYVEGGAHGHRRFVFYVEFTTAYLTSDSCRLTDHRSVEPYLSGEGDTLEQALGELAEKQLRYVEGKLQSGIKYRNEAEEQLATLRSAIEKAGVSFAKQKTEAAVVETGVFVSEEHRQAAEQRAKGVALTPVIKVAGTWLYDEERMAFGDWLDALAQSYGLPAPEKDRDGDVIHYGMDSKGQFTRWAEEA